MINRYEILKELDVKNIGIYNVLVVDSGRNAWYATWSRKFNKGKAFFLDLDSAKKYAEINRKQGTVFSIVPTPSIYFELHGIYIFLMDIASREPFSRWKLKKFVFGKKEIFLQDFYEEFRLNSFNWNYPVPDDDNFDVSMVVSDEDLKKNEVFASYILTKDSTKIEMPQFKNGAEEIQASRIRYNFKTQKGYIEEVKIKQDEIQSNIRLLEPTKRNGCN